MRLEEHAAFILFITLLLIIFWHAVWELLTEFTEELSKRYGIKKRNIYIVSVLGVVSLIGIFPQILERL
jgi:nitrate reductase gamma subunit